MALAVALGLTLAVALAGCGGGGKSTSSSTKPITLQPPTTPTAAQCGLTGAGSPRNADKPPKPGTYSYGLTGTRALIGDHKEVKKLPGEMKVIVTSSLRKGAQSCFIMQRRYQDDLGETGVFVVNGHDMLVRMGKFQAGADITEFTPDPPVLAVSGSEMQWSGAFRGATSGRYAASVVGRKSVRVGGQSVKVVGIETRVSYAGEIEGFERATRWISPRDGLVVSETVTQQRAFGLDHLRLRFSSSLKTLTPG